MNIFKGKCNSCGKKLGLFEKTYRWFSGSGNLKYCKECHSGGVGVDTKKPTKDREKPIIVPTKKSKEYKGYCNYCKAKKGFPDYFYCKYCKKYHCENHRLPEEHGCSNPKLPDDMKKWGSPVRYNFKKK